MTTATATLHPTTTTTAEPAALRRLAQARAELAAALAGLDSVDARWRIAISTAIEQLGGQADLDAPSVVLARQFAVLVRRARTVVPSDVHAAIAATAALTDFVGTLASR